MPPTRLPFVILRYSEGPLVISERPFGVPQGDKRTVCRGRVPILAYDVEIETDGRWLAEAMDLPGVLAYGATIREALLRARQLAICVFEDQRANGER